MAGTVLVSWTLEHQIHFKATPLIINLVSSLATALQIVTLRFGVVRLKKREPTIGLLEITAIKMSIATVCIVPAAVAVEPGAWADIAHLTWPIQVLLWGGVLLTMTFQTTVVGLLSCSLATTVGILSQFKIVPQIAFGVLLIDRDFDPSAIHLSGIVLVVISTVFYTVCRLFRHFRRDVDDDDILEMVKEISEFEVDSNQPALTSNELPQYDIQSSPRDGGVMGSD